MAKQVRETESTVVYDSFWLRVREDKIVDGRGTRTYPVVERGDSIIVIPLSSRHKTCLLKQYRHPIGGFSWEFPMGRIERGETPEEAARRELSEETEFQANAVELIGRYRAAPGLTPQQVFVFVAWVKEEKFIEEHTPIYTDDIVSSRIIPLREVQGMVAGGKIIDGFTLVGLLFAKLRVGKSNRTGAMFST